MNRIKYHLLVHLHFDRFSNKMNPVSLILDSFNSLLLLSLSLALSSKLPIGIL